MTGNPCVVIRRREPGAVMRMICFPYAGGAASIFRSWPERFPSGVELCAMEPPGRGLRFREQPMTALGPLVHHLVEALMPLLDRHFVLFGHSLGGLIGFELARELRRRGGPMPAGLFISACAAPTLVRPEHPLHGLPDDQLIAELRTLNGTPRELLANRELMDMVLPILRADFQLFERYTHSFERPLECPMTVFGGMLDSVVPQEKLIPWRDETRGNFSLVMLPGDHFFLNLPTFLPVLVEETERVLDGLAGRNRAETGDVPGVRPAWLAR